MSIQVGESVPNVTLKTLGEGGLAALETGSYFAGRKVVVFGVPGAFTPGCSRVHLPGFVANHDEIKAGGVDAIACLAVNDPWVMDAWIDGAGGTGKIDALPDGNGELTAAIGLSVDLGAACLGTRCKRFMAIVEDGKVTSIDVEPAKDIGVSSAESCLVRLGD